MKGEIAVAHKSAETKRAPYGSRTEGNLARKLGEEEKRARHSERRAEGKARDAQRRNVRAQGAGRTRQRQRVSFSAFAGFALLAVLVLTLVMSYAKLTAISSDVVAIKSELTALQSEHVTLLTRYEQTFDLAAIRKSAEDTGMAKPSASQIFYVDLSEPDSVVIYQPDGGNILSRFFASLERGMCSVVEYFR